MSNTGVTLFFNKVSSQDLGLVTSFDVDRSLDPRKTASPPSIFHRRLCLEEQNTLICTQVGSVSKPAVSLAASAASSFQRAPSGR